MVLNVCKTYIIYIKSHSLNDYNLICEKYINPTPAETKNLISKTKNTKIIKTYDPTQMKT